MVKKKENINSIPARLRNMSQDGHVAGSVDIIDDDYELLQSELNMNDRSDIKDLQERVSDLEGRANLNVEGQQIALEDNSDNIVPTQQGGEAKLPTVNATAGVKQYIEANIGYFRCISHGEVQLKEVIAPDYRLFKGGSIKVKMEYANTVSSVVMKIGPADPKQLYYNGKPVTDENTWADEEVIDVYFDGEVFQSRPVFARFGSGELLSEINIEQDPTPGHTMHLVTSDGLANTYGYYMNCPEFMRVITDAEGRIVEATLPDGTKMIPVCVESNKLKALKILEVCDSVTYSNDNPEWIRVVLDGADRILCGIKRDGSFEWTVGIPNSVKKYIAEQIALVMAELDKKVDKEEGKSLIDSDYANGVSYVESPEFAEVKLDGEGKILEAIKKDGTKLLPAGVKVSKRLEFEGNVATVEESPEFAEVKLDGEGKILEAIKKDGTKLLPAGVKVSKRLEFEGNVATVEESPEFAEVKLDGERRVLYGVQKDGNFYFGKGVPQQIIDYIAKESAETGKYIDNPVYVSIVVDGEGKILEARRIDGRKVINTDVELAESSNIRGKVQYEETASIEKGNNPEWASLLMNEGERIVAGFKTDGEFVWFKGVPAHLQKVFNYAWGGSHDYNIVTVKKDGTGDFTNIQEAINSIKDASVTNQYEVQVFDDYYINDLTELWEVHNPTVHSTAEPSEFVAYITTKDFVHLRGMGGKREIYVESPDINMPGRCFQNIHPIFVKGSCKIENFIFKVKGGRYAVHQDMSASKYGVDSFKTSIFKNIDAIHYGNSMYTNGSAWTGAHAQANGYANGQKQIYINVNWVAYDGTSGFYGHTNEQYSLPARLYLINCKCTSIGSFNTPSRVECYFGDRYSCQNNEVYIWGCDLPRFYGRAVGRGAMGDNFMNMAPKKRGTKRYCLNTITGSNNKPMVVEAEVGRALVLTTKRNSEKIEVVGGTAYDDIWGLTYKEISGNGIKGKAIGGNYIVPGNYSQVHNLAYVLGNCADNTKTLIVKITDGNNVSTEHTITFNKNYMTSDGGDYSYDTAPYISQSDIIAEVNADFAEYFTMEDTFEIIDTFIDCKEEVFNAGATAIGRGSAMVRDYSLGYHSWRMANAGEIADGFAMSDIGISGFGEVLLKEKNLFHVNVLNIQGTVTAGALYKVGANGSLTEAENVSEATLVALENKVLSNLKK